MNPKYLFTLDDNGFAKNFFIIRETHGDVLTVENFDEFIDHLVLIGTTYSFNETIVDESQYSEINIKEIGNHCTFYSKEAAIAFLERNYKKWIESKEEQ